MDTNHPHPLEYTPGEPVSNPVTSFNKPAKNHFMQIFYGLYTIGFVIGVINILNGQILNGLNGIVFATVGVLLIGKFNHTGHMTVTTQDILFAKIVVGAAVLLSIVNLGTSAVTALFLFIAAVCLLFMALTAEPTD